MICNRIYLREGREDVFLDTYVRDPLIVNTPRPAVLIIPGGCYEFCGSGECEPVAYQFLNMGYHAFVLYYSIGDMGRNPHDTTWPQPFLDAGAAILYIRDHADEFGVDPDQLAVCGFSAGGHLAAMCAFDWKNRLLQENFNRRAEAFRPQAAILVYPELIWHTEEDRMARSIGSHLVGKIDAPHEELAALCPIAFVNPDSPPVFIVHNQEDPTVPMVGSLELVRALRKERVPCELHVFDASGHGFSLGNNASSMHPEQKIPNASAWTGLMETWLSKYFTITLVENPRSAAQRAFPRSHDL